MSILRKYEDGGKIPNYRQQRISIKPGEMPQDNLPFMTEMQRNLPKPDLSISNNPLQLLEIPQKAMMKTITGAKSWDNIPSPSQAMNIKNPVGAFLTDVILDPTNLVGAGIAGKVFKVLNNDAKILRRSDVIIDATKGPKRVLDEVAFSNTYKNANDIATKTTGHTPSVFNNPFSKKNKEWNKIATENAMSTEAYKNNFSKYVNDKNLVTIMRKVSDDPNSIQKQFFGAVKFGADDVATGVAPFMSKDLSYANKRWEQSEAERIARYAERKKDINNDVNNNVSNTNSNIQKSLTKTVETVKTPPTVTNTKQTVVVKPTPQPQIQTTPVVKQEPTPVPIMKQMETYRDTIAPNRFYGQMLGAHGLVNEQSGEVKWDRPATSAEKKKLKK